VPWFSFKKKIPPFVVPKSDFSIAENFGVNAVNINELRKAHTVLEFIKTQKKLPDNPNDFPKAPIDWNVFQYLVANEITYFAKIKKNLEKGFMHSFLLICGRLFALDNKKRHKVINPRADGLLGKGGLGKIKQCQDNHRIIHAVKIQANKPESHYHIMRAIGVLKKLGYYVAHVATPTKIYIIMKYFRGINLHAYLNNNFFLSAYQGLSIALKISWALQHLHKRKIIHGDVKDNNFMISGPDEYEKITLIDFDGAWDIENIPPISESQKITIISNANTAPEAKEGKYYIKSDIYSLGYFFNDYKILSNHLAQLIAKMKKKQADQRPTIGQVIRYIQKKQDELKREHTIYMSLLAIVLPFAMNLAGPGALAHLAKNFVPNFRMILIGLASLISIMLKEARHGFKMRAFKTTVAKVNDPYELDPDLFDRLKSNQKQFLAFTEGYKNNRSFSVFQNVKSFFYLRNYSSAYYAGSRWYDLNPQDETFEENVAAQSIRQQV